MEENPIYKFEKTSVTLHFIDEAVDKKNECLDEVTIEIEATKPNPFSSFEKDLLNFQNQKKEKQILCSEFYPHKEKIYLIFPDTYTYTSEGKTHTLISKRNELEVIVSVSRTIINSSKRQIWHLSIAPLDGDYFNEYELIKLSSFFGSIQEQSSLRNENKICFKIEHKILKINDPAILISKLIKSPKDLNLKISGSGIIQIDESNQSNLDKKSLNKFFDTILSSERTSISKSIKSYSKVICGIILGIFDFDRMADEEIVDTIQPFMSDSSSFMVLCRGILIKMSKDSDDMMEIARETNIIVSPYLLIPSTVLAHNEYILFDTKDQLDKLLNFDKTEKLHKLEDKQTELYKTLNFQYIKDIFQYISEQNIIEKGEQQRGILNLQNYINKRLDELSMVIAIKRDNISNRSFAFLNATLVLIAELQLKGLFDSLKLTNDISSNNAMFYLTAATIAIIIYWVVRTNKRVKIFKKVIHFIKYHTKSKT